MTEPLDLDDVQGLVVRGYGALPFAAYLLVHVDDAGAARPALRGWAEAATAASASPVDDALNVAWTAAGIRAVCPETLAAAGFAEQFSSGMVTPYRSRLLGDVDEDDPAGWRWGGPRTPDVHLLVLLYARTAALLDAAVDRCRAVAGVHGLRVLDRLETDELTDREPFGFRDGVSQPVLDTLPRARQGHDVVRTGEFVLGYVNEYGQRGERPLLDPAADPGRLLPRDPDGSGAADLGRNGSYLVVRQLRQDVGGFWSYVDRQSRSASGEPDATRRELVAAKLVGRWRSGASLVLAPAADDEAVAARNDFGYQSSDPLGHACPIGSHVRRANPRDSLEPGPGTERSREVNRRHRLLRRGRSYTAPAADGDVERGLHFLCLNSSLARQFEFVQHSWVNDPSFNALHDSADPLVGPRGRTGASFAMQGLPLRTRLRDVPQFVQVRGGGYFFLPGIRALHHLASAPPAAEGARP